MEEDNGEEVTVDDKLNLMSQDAWPLYRYRWWLREYFSEFFGTFFLISFGDGVCATMLFHAGDTAASQTNASWLGITFGWGIGLTIALYVSMGVSGGHLNPAVTLANCVFGAFPWRKAPGFILAQILGGMVGGANVYALFKPFFDKGEQNLLPGETMTTKYGGIFCTYPGVPNGYAVWSELFNTMALMMGILGINDDRMTPAINFKPCAVGALVFCIGLTTGVNSGYAINPARDLGPRMITGMLWGSDPFTVHHHYFWIPMFCPVFGAIIGAFFYVLFIVPKGV
ncbi:putative mitochondrial Aquaporin 9 [Leptomonas pyrrhocoris]|uniref:Putative mitochondrial Aquaporin 9 n=1 Tax=Leptomonas pyrrhocoris TaxID=157538 RepID=A0A0M9FQN2_LEPPY|nr:putative mitochondrial Aquaporin 9 [Leptomonas pyrrhocoris]XP_015652466.1 putative mitochondrial Aquaporin 9 [Leptomonas pyrrhocoris]XP_015652470.1 putative mitochondrial Aquaporin 9 [Leptomonas pyrrhocoris]KPA74023.1 putative mitochondrial Aquaporin 9 [Leptomonas pyrrhocoris]KPA74027.1 putative mitochondrial Aquaporin 9 [Leptomonas pyrrhocoris]KPA74031.1 putative mitochondrial Aquaporin 9 [Leptomonas pyrrhocoris]|eukprot:XP_015652462.1 putative mitochondrial Aquaporin 9 [Leptomonas pyrrhocoris]